MADKKVPACAAAKKTPIERRAGIAKTVPEEEQCGYAFRVTGIGEVACNMKAGHQSKYHQKRYPTWTARHWPAQRSYFTTVDGARLPKEVIG